MESYMQSDGVRCFGLRGEGVDLDVVECGPIEIGQYMYMFCE